MRIRGAFVWSMAFLGDGLIMIRNVKLERRYFWDTRATRLKGEWAFLLKTFGRQLNFRITLKLVLGLLIAAKSTNTWHTRARKITVEKCFEYYFPDMGISYEIGRYHPFLESFFKKEPIPASLNIFSAF